MRACARARIVCDCETRRKVSEGGGGDGGAKVNKLTNHSESQICGCAQSRRLRSGLAVDGWLVGASVDGADVVGFPVVGTSVK